MAKLKVFLSDSFNPHLNLATEEWIFHNLDPASQILFLWRNESSVVIGRNQNPWSECNLAKMKEDKVQLARRTTGGGAVYHDLGNTNFTFLSPKNNYRRENNIEIIFSALRDFGVHGEASGRNDLLISTADGLRKFSGSAYREKKDRAFHHGTLLIHTDLTRLGQYLTPNPKKLQAKGKESVRAQVANLNEVSASLRHEHIVESVVRSFESFYEEKADIQVLSLESLKQNLELSQQYESLNSFDWLYGQTMAFNQQMTEYLSLGFFEFQFRIVDAVIEDLQIFSDCLHPALIEDFKSSLRHKPFRIETIQQTIKSLNLKYLVLSEGLNELGEWLGRQIEM